MTEPPMQECKHCGTKIRGAPAVGGGGGPVGPGGKLAQSYPLAYRFTCNGVGQHGDDNQDREWFWTVPDTREQEISKYRKG